MASEHIYTVSEITRHIKGLLDRDNTLQSFWVRAEISNFKLHKSSGHMYFTIKDARSKMNAVMFQGYNRHLSFEPKDGMKVLIRGNVSVYEVSGQYQLYSIEMQPDGLGSLFLAFEQLKERLSLEGLFREDIKKPLPKYAKEICIITSQTGAAIRDIVTTIKRRYPIAKISLIPALVQGTGAASSIARSIAFANQFDKFDVIIVGRGGGSIEELWAFNEEVVARAVHESRIPVISAVGHETDFTICDFVADVRAATPTAAAELAVPDQFELKRNISQLQSRLTRAIKERVTYNKEILQRLDRSYAFRYPEQLLRQKEQELDQLIEVMQKEMKRVLFVQKEKVQVLSKNLERMHPRNLLQNEKEKLEAFDQLLQRNFKDRMKEKEYSYHTLLTKLEMLSPLKMMDRGYNLTFSKEKNLIKSIEDVDQGDRLSIQLKDGELDCEVVEKISKETR